MSSLLPIGVDDEKVIFSSRRNPKLPDVYVAKSHPQQLGSGTAYYFIHNGSFEAAKSIYEMEVKELKIPQGSHDEAIDLGTHIFIIYSTVHVVLLIYART